MKLDYYKALEELNESSRKPTKRNILTPSVLKILFLLGILFSVVPLAIWGLWIYVFNLSDNHTDRVAIYESYFPAFLHGRYPIALLIVAFCVLSIILSSISLKLSGTICKTLNIFILILCGFLLLLTLWGLL